MPSQSSFCPNKESKWVYWKTEIHGLWKKKNHLQHNQKELFDRHFVSFGQAFNTELYGSDTLKHGSKSFLMAFKRVGKSLLFKPNIGYNSPLSSPVKKTVQLKIFGSSTKSNQKHRLAQTRKDRPKIIAYNVPNSLINSTAFPLITTRGQWAYKLLWCLGDVTSELHLNQYIYIVTKINIFKYPFMSQLLILVCIVKSIPVTTRSTGMFS